MKQFQKQIFSKFQNLIKLKMITYADKVQSYTVKKI